MALLLRLIAFGVLLRILRLPSGVLDIEDELQGMSWEKRSDVFWGLATRGRLPLVTRLVLGLPALYMMAPLDLMPDFVPFIGHLDDQVLVTVALQIARAITPKETLIAEIRRFAGEPQSA